MARSSSEVGMELEESLGLVDDEAMDETNRRADSRFSCNICLDPVTEPVVTKCGHLFCWPCLFRWLEPGILPEEAFWNNGIAVAPRPIDESRRFCPVCKNACSVPTIVPIYVRNEPSSPASHRSDRGRKEDENLENESGGEEERHSETETRTEADADEGVTDAPALEQTERLEEASPQPQQQLRQRLRFRSRDSDIPVDDVPARPAAVSPTRSAAASASRANVVARPMYRTPLSPTPQNRASLSHGLLLLFQQAVQNNVTSNDSRDGIPSLHRRDEYGHGSNARDGHPVMDQQQDDATEFLSRLLLMLGSFVILCLLIF